MRDIDNEINTWEEVIGQVHQDIIRAADHKEKVKIRLTENFSFCQEGLEGLKGRLQGSVGAFNQESKLLNSTERLAAELFIKKTSQKLDEIDNLLNLIKKYIKLS